MEESTCSDDSDSEDEQLQLGDMVVSINEAISSGFETLKEAINPVDTAPRKKVHWPKPDDSDYEELVREVTQKALKKFQNQERPVTPPVSDKPKRKRNKKTEDRGG
jgi:hypothetical protein